jgi:sugar/nucleoside kinase (ribokinase family)
VTVTGPGAQDPRGSQDSRGRDYDLVVVGDCNPDVLVAGDDVTPAFGQREKLVATMSLVIGGSAAITAVAAARLGLRVALVAAVGADPPGEFMRDQLRREGVDVAAVLVRPAEPTGMTLALSAGPDRAILTAVGAIASLTAADVPAALLTGARHVHVSSYFLLEQSLGPGLAAVLSQAKAAGVVTSLDTNWDPAERWGDSRLRAAFGETDLLLPNEAEALHLSGEPTLAGAIQVLNGTASRLALKLGPRGALSVDGPRRHHVQLPEVKAVDATGAGDCFNAGLIAGLLAGLPMPEAVALGCAVGALSTQAPSGTASCPDLASARALASQATINPASDLTMA